MANEESLKTETAPQPTPTPPPAMTDESWVAEFLALVKRGEDSGLSPTVLVFRAGFRKGVGWFDQLMGSLESNIGSGSGKKG